MDTLILANAVLFLSTLSLRRATREPTALRTPHHRFLSTLSLRRATKSTRQIKQTYRISIHALLAESDQSAPRFTPTTSNFYPRSPCGERLMDTLILANAVLFLSTLSLRRATIISPHSAPNNGNFYPRSPCGERQYLVRGRRPNWRISIHALLAESDTSL